MKQKIKERLRAVKLRERGYSVNEIVSKIDAAKSSVSTWVRNVSLDEPARSRLLTRIKLGQLLSAESKRKKTAAAINAYRESALQEINERDFDRIFKRVVCSLVYWCEGVKSHYHGVSFINSDPRLIATFLSLFRKSFEIDERKFRARIHLHQYHKPKKQLAFWSRITRIPLKQFGKPYLKPNTGKRIRKDYPGCVTIRYYNNDIARQLLATATAFLIKFGGVGQW